MNLASEVFLGQNGERRGVRSVEVQVVGRVLRVVWEGLLECVGKWVESHGGRRRWGAMGILGDSGRLEGGDRGRVQGRGAREGTAKLGRWADPAR